MKIMSYSYKLLLCASVLLTTNSLKAIEGFSLIPAGSFTMGNSMTEDADITDAPIRTVTLDAFYMGKYEVTKAEWDEVRTWGLANGYTDLADGAGKAGNHPVHSISWYDMVKWCNARSEKEGLAPVYYANDAQTTIYKTGSVNVTNAQVKWTANGYRLPTEAEWEKAARGGLNGDRFPWGNMISHDQANFNNLEHENYQFDTRNYHAEYSEGIKPYTAPVGSFVSNDYGLHDIVGNVWEMCWDIYGSYPSGNLNNPRGALSGAYRIFRGGSWDDEASCMRIAFRGDDGKPEYKDYWTGFRLAIIAISINGKVTNQDGSPLSGVQVTAHQYDLDSDSSYPLAWASTDASGKYALEGLDPGTYRIRFNGWADEPPLSDFAPQYFNNAPSLALAQNVVLTSSGSVNNIDAALAEASRITGKITSESDGTPIQNILVLAHRLMGNGEWDWSSWVNFTSSKSDGSYALNLPEGTYMVSFHDYNNKHYVTEFYDNQRKSDNALAVVLGSNSTVSNINASLAEGSYIEGVVRADGNATPLQGISVSVHEYNEEDGWWNWVGGAETDQSGAYTIGGLGAGIYRVEFRDSNGVYAFEAYNDAANVELGDDVEVADSSKVTGINASLAKASSISGKVTGLDGIELSTVELDLERLGDDGQWHWHADTETDEDGDYELSGLKPGVYRIEFEDESGEYAVEYYNNAVEFDLATNINLGNEQHLTIDASMLLGSRISGKVTGPDGSPLADVWVEAFRLNSKGKWEWYEDTEANADGTYQIGGLPNGTYRVGFIDDDNFYSVQFNGSTGSTMYFESAKQFVINSPQTIFEVNGKFNERAATIAGNVRDANGEPLSGVRIEAYRKDNNDIWRLVLFGDMKAGDNGSFPTYILPAGIYRFKFEKEGYITNYYGNSPTLNNAKDIVVGDGGYVGGIDVVMLSENSIPPFISSSPGSASIVVGQSFTFGVQASGINLSYQWYKNSNIIPGANAPSLILPSAQLSDAGSYSVMVSNSAGEVTSEAATLTVITSPSISSPPSSISVISGQDATFRVQANGMNLSYQWYKGGAMISGANASSLTMPSTQVSDAGSYTVKVSNQAGEVTSEAATLTVVLPPITSDLSDALVAKGKAINPYKVTTSFGANSYSVKKLPPGLKFNAKTGVISGKPKKPGTYRVVITAAKKKGKKILQKETVVKVFVVK
jgi:formylglycine-generating enzyme required for sulfatase activity/protocatechuate 3,4-dioxygenase beta subunit